MKKRAGASTADPAPGDLRQNVGRKTVGNALWSYLSFALGKVLTFIATVILVRLLSPEEFGLMAYCLLGIQYLDVLTRFGLNAALISRRDRIEEAANTIFLLSLATGTIFYVGAWLAAPFLGAFFRTEAIIDLFRVLALVLLIEAVSIVHGALLQRHLRFRAKLIPDLGKGLVKGGTAIVLALAGYGVWSLIWGQLAGALFVTLALWVLTPWRPSLRFDLKVGREVLHFGGHMIAVDLIGALRANVDYLLVGRILGTASLGLYTIAYRLPELAINSLNNAVGAVTHPILSHLQGDAEEVRTYYAAYLRYIALLAFPVGVGIAAVAEPFVLTFYTEKWSAVIFPMQCIALAMGFSSIGFIPGVLYKAMNRPQILTRVSLIQLPFALMALWYAAGYGLVGVAIAQLLLAGLYVAVDSVIVNRILGFGLRPLLRTIAPALMASVVMGLVVGVASWALTSNNAVELVLLIVLGATTYLATLHLVSPDLHKEVLTALRKRIDTEPFDPRLARR